MTHTYTQSAEVNDFILMNKDLIPINATLHELPLYLSFKSFGFLKGQMVQQMNTVMEMQKALGMTTENEFDDIKSMFLETNIYLLILTGVRVEASFDADRVDAAQHL